MPIPETKNELLKAIEKNFSLLIKDLETVPLEKALETTLEGHAKGTMMSVHNLVSYLLGWNKLVLKWIEKDKKEENIDFPESGFKWNQLGELAQKFYSDYETVPFEQLLSDFQQVKQNIVEFLVSESNEYLYGDTWYEKYTMGRMIQFNTSSPYANARTRLRKWKKLNQI